ncbi:MAG TPA: circularly permuted type 2 ATP-grasp protein [Bryobacteraceae bacterium]
MLKGAKVIPTSIATGMQGMVRQYIPRDGHWDEALLPSGFPRRHWRKLSVTLGRMGFRQLTRQWWTAQQLIQSNGVTYNVYGDPQGKERPWLMDPIPLLIDEAEWAGIERAIVQRATLLNTILADLYGDQKLLHSGRIPAALVYANPNFLRPCFGIKPPGNTFIHSYAADLARSPDGQWWVIADRTQAPSGVGYALENRVVSARTLPTAFNLCQVRPLNRYFDVQREAFLAMASRRDASPRRNSRVVLLTPGPHNETYFEHSFLARHWGFPLVEGADLIARDNQIFLKTLAGLEPVDLIVRRVDDSFCDPLELRGESLLGVPGLLQAVRAGGVAIANALGSGLMETPAQMAFLPGLCRDLLGEELRIPSVATWWCGQGTALGYVLDHLEELVIKPAFPGFGKEVEIPALMDKAAREALTRRIEANPGQFVAQEQVALSTAPVRTEYGVAPRHVVVRVFAAWNGGSYTMLPGGLTRISTADKSLVVSMQQGGGSKDTWALGAEQISEEDEAQRSTPVLASESAAIPRDAGDLPSRAADNLFWLGRYTERVEDNARLVRTLLPCLSGEADFGRSAALETVTHLLSNLGYLAQEFPSALIAQQRWQLQRLLTGMVYNPSRSTGIGWNLKQIRRVAWPLKERLSQDTWRVLQELDREFVGSSAPAQNSDQTFVAEIHLLDRAIVTLSAFAGLLMENTTRGYGWHFLEIGRRLERALDTANLLNAALARTAVKDEDDMVARLQILLQIADSSITYRMRFFTEVRTEFVLNLLLADETNPRSVAFQLVQLLDQIQHLPRCQTDEGNSPEYWLVSKALALVRQAWMSDLAKRDSAGKLSALGELALHLRGSLYEFSDALTGRYLSHLSQSRI